MSELSEKEINEVVLKVAQKEGFNDVEGYHRVHADEFVKAGAEAQLKKLSIDKEKLVEKLQTTELNKNEDYTLQGKHGKKDHRHLTIRGANKILSRIAPYLKQKDILKTIIELDEEFKGDEVFGFAVRGKIRQWKGDTNE